MKLISSNKEEYQPVLGGLNLEHYIYIGLTLIVELLLGKVNCIYREGKKTGSRIVDCSEAAWKG